MRRRTICGTILAAVVAYAVASVPSSAFADEAGDAAVFADGDRVVFFGDSITHNGCYLEQIAIYYATRFPDRDIWFSGSGESGGNAGEDSAMRRLDDDVVSKSPTVVTVMFGMNDVRRNEWPREGATESNIAKHAQSFLKYTNSMTRLVAAIRERAGGPRVIRLTPTPFDQTCLLEGKPSELVCNDGLAVFAEWLRGEAKREGAPIVDLQAFLHALNDREQAKDPCWSFMRGGGTNKFDRVHPSEFGHTFVTYAFLKSQGAPSEVSTIAIDAGRGLVEKSGNAVVSELTVSGEEMAFTALEKALPYPLEGECADAARYVPFVEELNREMFSVKGFAPGEWELSIDGEKVGCWSSLELDRGINLATCRATPQYRQALKVRELNAEAWKKDTCVRDVKMWRLWNLSKLPVDDVLAIRTWYAEKYPDGPKDWSGRMAQIYVENMENVETIWKEAESLKKSARVAATPVPRRWRLKRMKCRSR